jgi:hypothetical protein
MAASQWADGVLLQMLTGSLRPAQTPAEALVLTNV